MLRLSLLPPELPRELPPATVLAAELVELVDLLRVLDELLGEPALPELLPELARRLREA
jgi:hypothetical protein